MKKLILLTLLLMLSINTLSFAQETEKPKKERNWIVGTGWSPGTSYDINNRNIYSYHYNFTVGYKGFTVTAYLKPTAFSLEIPNKLFRYLTVGYQHVFSKESNAKVKPIVGLELGAYAAVVNVGVQYKRSQFLLSVNTFSDYRSYLQTPLYTGGLGFGRIYPMLKYQFLF